MGIRTPGLVIANDALYQLSYTPDFFCGATLTPASARDKGGASEGVNQFANVAADLTRRALEQLSVAASESAEG